MNGRVGVDGPVIESLRCRNCGAALEAGRVDRTLGVVVCGHCGGLHPWARDERTGSADGEGAAEGRGRGASSPARGVAPLPKRFAVNRGEGTLQVRWAAGRRSGAFMLAVFGLAWAAATISTGLIPLAPVALLLLYYAAVRGVNRTELRASRDTLEIRRGPLPWRGARVELARADVAQLCAREVVTRSSMDSRDGRQVRESRSYAVVALDATDARDGGAGRTLIGGLSSPAHALWFEREIEQLFGIEDAAVANEVR